MQKGKVMILGLSVVLIVAVLIIGLVTNINRRKQSSNNNENHVLSSTTKSVASVCSITDFKQTCVDSLNSLANNQSATPKDFLQQAIHVTILEVEAVMQRSSSLTKKANDSLNRLAVDDCKDLLQFAIDELQSSFSSVGDSQVHTISDREEELNNWLSAAVSYQQTCMDGFSQPDLKDTMSKELLNATQLTDNALAIVSELTKVLEQFNITIPEMTQSNDTSTATSRKLLKQDDDDYYPASLSVGDRRRKLLKQDDDDYHTASLSVGALSVGDRRRRSLKQDDYYPASLSVGDRRRRSLKQDDDYYPVSLSVGDRHRRSLKQDDYYPASLSVGDRRRRSLKQDDYYPASLSVGDRRRRSLKQDDYYPASLSVGDRRRRSLKQDDYYPASLSVGDRHRRSLKQDDYYPASLSVGDRRRRSLKQDDYYPASLSVGDRRRRSLKQDDYYPASLFVGDRRRRSLKQDDYYPASLSVGERHRRLLKQDDDYYPASLSVGDRRRRSLKQDDYYPASLSVGDRRRRSLKQDDYYPASLSVGDRRRRSLKQDNYYPASLSVGDRRRRSLKQDDDYYPASLSVGDRRLLGNFRLLNQDSDNNYPSWVSAGDRHLLAAAIKKSSLPTPNAVVAKDGTGQFKTITQALAAYPKKPLTGSSRYVIYVKEGVYEESVMITKDQTNVFIYGDGPRRTIVTGKKSFAAGVSTYQTATFAAIGNGFIAMSMGMSNTAGPQGHQAVALRVQSDMAAIYNCRMDGHQDTLYAQTHRQFYRNCVISGTIDFIFGDSSVVIQNCLIIVRKPMDNQQNTVTAHGRAYSHENTGIVIQNCKIVPEVSLEPLRFKIPTYLGRPWKQYSRAVIMESTLGDFIHPDGWMPWSGNFALDTLYFAEHANRGPGANTAKRVRWKGYHVITNKQEAIQFTAATFIQGNQWLKPTGVPYFLNFYRM